jgi:P27 family predicted phage terminase small subunit
MVSTKRPKSKAKPPISAPKVPKGLSAVAQREWERIVTVLAATDRLPDVDPALLNSYITSFAKWQAAEKMLKRQGLVVRETMRDRHGAPVGEKSVANPYVKISRDNQLICVRLTRQMGLTAQRKPAKSESTLEALYTRAWELHGQQGDLLAQRDELWKMLGRNPWDEGDPEEWTALEAEYLKVEAQIAAHGKGIGNNVDYESN